MMRAWFIAAFLLLSVAGAGAQSPKATVNANIASQITAMQSNTAGAITPAILGALLTAMVNSYDQYPGVNAQTGTSYAIVLADYGQLVTFNNGSAVAVTLPQATGNFSPFSFMVKNLGAGAVTVTPTTSTINGNATLVLQQSQSVRIWSDGTNYQTTALQSLSTASNTLGGDVNLSNTGTYFDGPSMAQGTIGTWWVSGKVTLLDTAGSAAVNCKLWDGTTVIDSGRTTSTAANTSVTMALGGFLAAPVGNIRISCEDVTATTGKIKFNASGNSADSTISGIRIN